VQGFVCLMQLSTRDEDFVIDALALRSQIGALSANGTHTVWHLSVETPAQHFQCL
jgi:hypothetical protein